MDCQKLGCKNGGLCKLSPQTNKLECVCDGTDHFGDYCQYPVCNKDQYYNTSRQECMFCLKCNGKWDHLKPGTECSGATTNDTTVCTNTHKKTDMCSQGKFWDSNNNVCLDCSNCDYGYCAPGEYYNTTEKKCKTCRSCNLPHQGGVAGRGKCDGTGKSDLPCVQFCLRGQAIDPGPDTNNIWNDATCVSCDRTPPCTSPGQILINECTGKTFKSQKAMCVGEIIACNSETDCTSDPNANPWYGGKSEKSDWRVPEVVCQTVAQNKDLPDDFYFPYPQDDPYKTIKTLGYHTYMLQCKINDSYKDCPQDSTCDDRKCYWCQREPSCRPKGTKSKNSIFCTP